MGQSIENTRFFGCLDFEFYFESYFDIYFDILFERWYTKIILYTVKNCGII